MMKVSLPFQIPEYLKAGFDRYKYVLLVCVVGLALVLWPSGAQESTEIVPEAVQTPTEQAQAEADALAQQLEASFAAIEGVGRVEVILTLQSGYESVYSYDQTKTASQSADSASSTVQSQLNLRNEGGGQTPVMLKTNYPVFYGAVVICDGGDHATIQLHLTEAIRSLTGIRADNIVILKMQQS